MTKRRISCGRASVPTGRVLPVILAAALLSACSANKADTNAGKVIETNTDPNVFIMKDPSQFPVGPVQVRDVYDEMHANGVIAPDVNREVPVVSLGGGRVVEIKAKLGDSVKKGEVLLLINSPDLTSAISDYQKFKADEELVRKQVARAQLLYDKGAIALADLEAAQDADAKAKVDLQAAADRVRVLGGDIDHPSGLLPLRAPISGTIVDQQITGGTGVKSLDNQGALFTIADLSEVWVLADAYQDMLPRIKVGDPAEVSVNGYAGQKYPGTVINISEVLDPATRAAKVRIQLQNTNRVMKAGMFVTAMFRSREQVQRVVVPASAVVHLHDKDWVYTPQGEGKFRRVALQLGPTLSDGSQQVISGLKPDDQVVLNALQFSSAVEE
ncbi:MAG: efflux RND transporter periplasmic adaptor subunit [Candidatus Korobacteraceae bacterium]